MAPACKHNFIKYVFDNASYIHVERFFCKAWHALYKCNSTCRKKPVK